MHERYGHTHSHINKNQVFRKRIEFKVYIYIERKREFYNEVNNVEEGNNHTCIHQSIL